MNRGNVERHFNDRFLLGDNPFIGVNHLSQERSRERAEKFDSAGIASIISSALDSGAQGLVCSVHPNMANALRHLRDRHYEKAFGINLIVPDIQYYVRRASEKGTLGLVTEALGGLSPRGKATAFIGSGLSVLSASPTGLMTSFVSAQMSQFEKFIPARARVKSVFLHELLTELMVSFNMKELAQAYIGFVKDTLGVCPGFVTRNFARFVDFALEAGLSDTEILVMTPFNKVGFQMNPSRDECEAALRRIGKIKVVAMSVLAAGFIDLNEAITYLANFPRIESVVVGCTTSEQARETFSSLQSRLH